MSEGLGAQLDPEFRLMEFAEPYFRRFYLQSRSLGKQVKRIVEGMQEITELGLDFPGHARRMISQLERGEMTFTARLDGLEGALWELRQSANRVSVSILTASLVIGLGLLMLIYHPPGWERLGGWVFGSLFAAVVLFSLGLLWKIRRSGR